MLMASDQSEVYRLAAELLGDGHSGVSEKAVGEEPRYICGAKDMGVAPEPPRRRSAAPELSSLPSHGRRAGDEGRFWGYGVTWKVVVARYDPVLVFNTASTVVVPLCPF
jgi:hypothetical protein